MKKIKMSFFVFALLMFSAVAYADTFYTEAGSRDGYFTANNTLASINDGFLTVNYDTYTRALSSSEGVPLVEDLDGDGVNEVIVLDNAQFRLYNNKELTPSLVYNIPTSEEYSNVVVYDVDNDGLKEIVFSRKDSMDIIFLNYNGTSFYNKTSLYAGNVPIFTVVHAIGDRIIKCGEVGQCAMVLTLNNTVSNSGTQVMGIGISSFNTTGIYSNVTVEGSVGNNKAYCFSQIPIIEYADYDGDGFSEYIFTYQKITSTTDTFTIAYFQNDGNVITLDRSLSDTPALDYGISIGTKPCRVKHGTTNTTPGGYFTSPIVFPFQDIDPYNGMETIIGIAEDEDEFKMKSYKPTGTTESSALLSQYPNTQEADGFIVSNLFRANAFPSSKAGFQNVRTDVCVVGYRCGTCEGDNTNSFEVICGSEMFNFEGTVSNFNNVEYFFGNTTFNVSRDYGNYNVMAHAIQSKTDTINNNNMDEVLTPFGIFELTNDDYTALSCGLNSQCELSPIWNNPKGDGAIIPVDVEKVGYDDILLLKENNLWYFDDKYSNDAPVITSYSTAPCRNTVWKNNETLFLTITATDSDVSDLISARAILYYGSIYAIDTNWTANYSSGTTIPLSIYMNTTITSGVLRLMATDTFSFGSHIDTVDLAVTIADEGLTSSDCSETVLLNLTASNATGYRFAPNITNNAISSTLQDVDDVTGFGLGVTVWYLICMLLVGIGACGWIITSLSKYKISATQNILIVVLAVVFIITEVIIAIIGFTLKILGVGSALILLLAFISVIIIFTKTVITPSSGSGG